MEKLAKGNNPSINKLIDLLINQIEIDSQLKLAINKPIKTIEKCWNYILKEARKQIVGQSGVLTSDVVLGLAIHYFTEDIEELDNVTTSITNDKPKLNKNIHAKVLKKESKKTKSNVTLIELDLFGDSDVL